VGGVSEEWVSTEEEWVVESVMRAGRLIDIDGWCRAEKVALC